MRVGAWFCSVLHIILAQPKEYFFFRSFVKKRTDINLSDGDEEVRQTLSSNSVQAREGVTGADCWPGGL